MTRIRFEDLPSTNTPRNAENLNKLNNVVISPTEPTTGEEVWIKKSKNLFNHNHISNTYGLTKNGKEFSFNSSLPYGEFDCFGYFEVGKPYTFSFNITEISASSQYFAFFFYKDNTYDFQTINSDETGRYSVTVTPTKEVWYAKLRFFGGSTTQRTGKVADIQIEQGSTATDYETYINKRIFVKNDNGVYDEFYNENNNLNVYSTDEIKVGVWTNGQPIYRKVIGCGYLTAGSQTINHNIENIDAVLSARGYFHNTNTGTWFPIPRAYPTDAEKYNVAVDAGKQSIYLTSGTNYNGTTFYARIIMEYTKTTD